jgi:hypothetical protein
MGVQRTGNWTSCYNDKEDILMDERTEPDEATHVADESDADRTHEADRSGTAEEERAAEEAYSAGDPEERRKVAEHEKEMMDIGATIKGEGEI